MPKWALNMYSSTYSLLSINSFMASYSKECSDFCNIFCIVYIWPFSGHLQDFPRGILSKELVHPNFVACSGPLNLLFSSFEELYSQRIHYDTKVLTAPAAFTGSGKETLHLKGFGERRKAGFLGCLSVRRHLINWSFCGKFNLDFQMFKLVLEKAEEPEIKLPTSTGSCKKQESSRKTSTSTLLTMPKPLTVWITTNCGKFFKRWEYQTT